MAALRPTAPYLHDPGGPRYEAERSVRAELVCLAGSDLDADTFMRDPRMATDPTLPRLLWITVPGMLSARGGEALRYHHATRFKSAMGASPPRLTVAEWDALVGGGRLLHDLEDAPSRHDILSDVNPRLLARLAHASVDLRDNTDHSPDLADMRKVLDAPADVDALRAFAESDRLQTRLIALWRLERLLEGNITHLQNGYLLKLNRRLHANAAKASREAASSPCCQVREGLFPTLAMWSRALAAHVERRAAAALRP